ncbi:unnamed protein product [Schistosoma turkestanicum]|nr:unnamed protein product [Schistosoma turkestanicum]
MAQNLQGLRRAIENSGDSAPKPMDSKDPTGLKQALVASTVDLSSHLTNDVQILLSYLSSTEPDLNAMKRIIEELLILTDELDQSNIFLNVGGQDVLNRLLFRGPPSLRIDGLKLLANITQNNSQAQKLYTDNGVLARLILMFKEETGLEFSRHLLLAISCITQTYAPGISVFTESKGVDLVLDALIREVKKTKSDEVNRLVAKGAFLVYCVMQEPASKPLQSELPSTVHKLIDLLYLLEAPQEHLLATLTFLLCPSDGDSSCATKILSEKPYESFRNWLQRHFDELRNKNDPADEERLNYINCLLKVLS